MGSQLHTCTRPLLYVVTTNPTSGCVVRFFCLSCHIYLSVPSSAELSAEEAALATQQADAARKEKIIAATLAEGDAELAKIDALDSVELDNLDPDELAALEAELAELEGEDVQAPLGAAA